MLHLTVHSRVIIATKPVDFRKQIDGLVALCKNDFNQRPDDGALYVFINKTKTMIKVLHYESNGYWLAVKRLSRGKYLSWPNSNTKLTSTSASDLQKILKSMVDIKSQLL